MRHRFNDAHFARIAESYETALDGYRRGDFAAGAECFRVLAAEDRPSALLAERAQALAAHPPGNWGRSVSDGDEVMLPGSHARGTAYFTAGFAPGSTGLAPSPMAKRWDWVPTYMTPFATIGVE